MEGSHHLLVPPVVGCAWEEEKEMVPCLLDLAMKHTLVMVDNHSLESTHYWVDLPLVGMERVIVLSSGVHGLLRVVAAFGRVGVLFSLLAGS